MADAKAVYKQFLLTPLKLKPQRRDADLLKDDDGVAGALGFDLASETDEEERERAGHGGHRPPVHASPEVERLRGRIESADLSGDGQVAAAPIDAAPAPDSRRRAQKKKRLTRAAAMQSARSGAEWFDTPSKAGRPPKRSRRLSARAETDKENRDGSADSAAALSLLRRRLSDSFGAEHEDCEATSSSSTSPSSPRPSVEVADIKVKEVKASAATQSVRRSRRLARPPNDQERATPAPRAAAVDLLTPLCDELIATNTVAGLLFALSLNALRSFGLPAAPIPSREAASADHPLQGLYNICWGIAQCEQLTQQQLKRPTVQLSPKWRHESGARALEKVLAATRGPLTVKSPVRPKASKKKEKKTKKSVRFRSFDLSCLSLQYSESERVGTMVDHMIAAYGKLMDDISSTLKQSEEAQAAPNVSTWSMLRELAGVMASESRLLQPRARSTESSDAEEARVLDLESADAARIVDEAFSSRDSETQHEVRLAAAYFAQQFKRLAPTSLSSPGRPIGFLHEMFSPLISSAVRYKLRVIFLHSTSEDEQAQADGEIDETLADTTQAALAAATYTHQDVGAAIHRALQESLLYLPLVSPMLTQLDGQHGGDRVDAVVQQLKQRSADDIERVDQFILARRYLQYHLPRAVDPIAPSSEITSSIWREVERICSVAQRLGFEDEAHLFPLASVRTLSESLASEGARLERLDRAVQAFWEAQDGYEASRANGLHECAECRAVISRAEAAASIACSLCSSCFHLQCLHLPASFAQFAAHYTCPACFLGRASNRLAY